MNDLLIKLLELFCKIGVRIKETTTKTAQKVQKILSYYFNDCYF
jgi:hypothetical protein